MRRIPLPLVVRRFLSDEARAGNIVIASCCLVLAAAVAGAAFAMVFMK